jgi:diadenosine tetraphosphate (Ap4A) HIT family hydrolase
MPPLGQFIEGGLLVLSRQHFPSFAYLPPDKLERLGHLLTVIRRELAALYGTAPVIFEHGSAPQRSKGVCCVDHAHFNIFPAKVLIDPHLTQRMSVRLQQLQDMIRLRRAEFGYLLVLENDGSIRGYDGQLVPTQLVRRIITAQLGLPERWHWKDYPGTQELLATYNALHGKIRL